MKETNNDSLPVIIGNPYFYKYPCNSSNFYKRVLDEMISMIFREQYYRKREFTFEGQKILFYNTPMALYADVFIMLGFDVFTFEINEGNKKLINTLADEKNIHITQISNDIYTWAVVEGKSTETNLRAEKIIRISNEEHRQALTSGLVNGKFVSAFMEKDLNEVERASCYMVH